MENYHPAFMRRCFMNGGDCNMSNSFNYNSKQVFAAMQYDGKNNVQLAIEDAAVKSGYAFTRADTEQSNMMIPCKVCKEIQNSQFVVADISERNPNVLFELGIAAALGRTILLIKDSALENVPSDLNGLEYQKYDLKDIGKLRERLSKWFDKVKSANYQFDDYLAGHLLRATRMEIKLDNFNDSGDTKTEYIITAQKIGISEDETVLFAMPYHDSDSVDVSDKYFDLKASDTSSGNALGVKKVVFTNRLRRFCIILDNLELDDEKKFVVSLKEKQLFNQKGKEEYYDINITHPIETLHVEIKFNPKWKVSEKPRVCYGESGLEVKSEKTKLEIKDNTIIAEFKRPKVGMTYFIRWNWPQ